MKKGKILAIYLIGLLLAGGLALVGCKSGDCKMPYSDCIYPSGYGRTTCGDESCAAENAKQDPKITSARCDC